MRPGSGFHIMSRFSSMTASLPCQGEPREVSSSEGGCAGLDGDPGGCTLHAAPLDLGGSSCMVKITPNAPNLDHEKKNNFSRALFFENRILVQRKYLSHHLCHFVPFFEQPKTEKKLSFQWKMMSF